MAKDVITEATLRNVKEQLTALRNVLIRLAGSTDYATSIQMLQVSIREMPSAVPFARDAAERLMPEAIHGNTVRPELFSHYLAEIDTEEKSDRVLAGMTESDGQQLSRYLTEMSKTIFPNIREGGLDTLKDLPHRRSGGRKKEVDEKRAERIRGKIAKHIEHGVNTGDAQRRVADDEELSERTVREVWQSRKKKSGDSAEKT